MSNVLVTGGTGFVGAYLIQALLRRGDRVFALRRKTSPMHLVQPFQHQVQWVEGDLLDSSSLEAALHGIDQLYHAGAMVSFNPKDAPMMHKINIEGTHNLVEAALLQGVKRMVHLSSIAALGRKENQVQVHEDSAWENSKLNSQYAISKFKGECAVWRGMEEGLNAVILNPGLIFGAGYWDSGTGQLVDRVARGLRYYPAGATCLVDVRDVAELCLQLMDSGLEGERYIAASANCSYQQILGSLAKGLDVAPPKIAAQPWMTGLAWRLEWLRAKVLGQKPVITQETVRNAQSRYEYSNSKIIQALNFSFRPWEQTLLETAQAYRAAKEKGRNHSFWLEMD